MYSNSFLLQSIPKCSWHSFLFVLPYSNQVLILWYWWWQNDTWCFLYIISNFLRCNSNSLLQTCQALEGLFLWCWNIWGLFILWGLVLLSSWTATFIQFVDWAINLYATIQILDTFDIKQGEFLALLYYIHHFQAFTIIGGCGHMLENDRITELQGLEETSRYHQFKLPCKSRFPSTGHTVKHPDRSWICP